MHLINELLMDNHHGAKSRVALSRMPISLNPFLIISGLVFMQSYRSTNHLAPNGLTTLTRKLTGSLAFVLFSCVPRMEFLT